MKKLNILHLGIGNVGREVIRQITQQKKAVRDSLGVSLDYQGEFTSKNTPEEINNAIQNAPLPFVLIDTTASEKTLPFLKLALKRGGFVVLANKKPLSGKQKDFDDLHKLGGKRLLYECTVGAGLPVIQTLKNLIITGDEILEIQGCFSGTLGFLFSQIDEGMSFSQTVLEAKEKGFTEPDPRDDLSGMDVARKALILARILGRKVELDDIQLESLYPEKLQKLNVEDFLKQLNTLDASYKEKQEKAQQENKVLRFVAQVTPEACTVGLQAVDAASEIGSLRGPDNLIVFKTKRYSQNPLVVKGPGAGIVVTAAGVFADVLAAAKML